MDKPHVSKRELDFANSRSHVKLGHNPLNSLRHFQKAQLELVEPNINTGQSWLS